MIHRPHHPSCAPARPSSRPAAFGALAAAAGLALLPGCNQADDELRQVIADDYAAYVLQQDGGVDGDRADDTASRIVRGAFAEALDVPQEFPVWMVLFDGFALNQWIVPPPAVRDPAPASLATGPLGTPPEALIEEQPFEAPATVISSTLSRTPEIEIEPWRVENGLIMAADGAGELVSRQQFGEFEIRIDARLEPGSVVTIGFGEAGELHLATPALPEIPDDDETGSRVNGSAPPQGSDGEADRRAIVDDEPSGGTSDSAWSSFSGYGRSAEMARREPPSVRLEMGAGRSIDADPAVIATAFQPQVEWSRVYARVEDGVLMISVNEVPIYEQPLNAATAVPPGPIMLDVPTGRGWFRNIFVRPLS